MARHRLLSALCCALSAAVAVVLPAGPAAADDVPAAAAAVVVRLPLTGTRDTQVKAAILRAIDGLRPPAPQRGVLVLEFRPTDEEGALASDFGRAVELARFLGDARLGAVKTVAFLPEGLRGHAVLAALACEEIVMPADAVLGPANAEEPAVDDAMRAAYAQVADRRKTVPPALALALLDPAAKVVRVATDDGERFVAERDLDAVKRDAAVLSVDDVGPVPLALTGRRAREFGVVRLLASTPAELARGLGVAERSLVADVAGAGGWRAVQVVVAGPITADAVARTRRAIDEAVAGGANFICLRIDSPGGDPEQSLVLATWLATLDPSRVRTVAWVPREARADAALVALACDELAITPVAVLGGEGAATIDPRRSEALAVAWAEGVAKKRGRSWSLPVALVVPGMVVRRATQQATGRVDFFSDAELLPREDRESWKLGDDVGVGPIELSGRTAESLGLATHVIEGFPALVAMYGLPADIALKEPGWADRLLDALASPGIAWLLLLIGGAGLYIEMHTPGVGLGGFVAMVAFIVYFWSQHLHGTSGWLEVMLFLAGLFCLAAEIFVLPGFGVLGLGGGLLVIAALVLASQSFVLPSNDYQIRQLQWSLLGILGAAVGVALVGVLVRRWLPQTPVLRHVLLEPPPEDTDAEEPPPVAVGRQGVAATRLVPAGKARIDGHLVDVATDGLLVEPGEAVQVVEVRGGRIVVRPVGGTGAR
jgi:membrane-bound ClpP family serine protease